MKLRGTIAALAAWMAIAPAAAAVFDWSSTCTNQHRNPDNVRDPTIVYNNTSLPNWYVCPGYDNTMYAFKPCNWPATTATVPCGAYNDNNGNPVLPVPTDCPATWVDIPLDQFGIPATATRIMIYGRAGTTSPPGSSRMWNPNGTQQVWFRKPGSSWNHSPAWQVGYLNDLGELSVPIGLVNGVPTLEMAWATTGLVLAPTPNYDTAYINLILAGYCD